MLLELHSRGLFSGHEGVKCTQRCSKDKTNKRGKKSLGKRTISSTILWKSYCPDGTAAEVALTVDTNLENTRKHEFVWADPSTRWVFAFGHSELFPGQGLGEGRGLCSFISNHGYPPLLTLTLVMDLPGHWGLAWRPDWWPSFYPHGKSRWLV